MKRIDDIIKVLQYQKPFLSQRYGVMVLGVFGSFVRGEHNEDSDIDILIELEETRHLDLLDLVRLERYLSELLGVKADLAIKSGLRKRIGKRILDEVVMI